MISYINIGIYIKFTEVIYERQSIEKKRYLTGNIRSFILCGTARSYNRFYKKPNYCRT